MQLPDIEVVSAKVHESWMESKRKAGVTSRKLETGEELMVPYADLSDEAKELDRGTVRAVYDAINAIPKVRPTIHELEAILREQNSMVTVNPDGSVSLP